MAYNKTLLAFHDNDTEVCEVLGSITVDYENYAVFLSQDSTMYVYRYEPVKKGKIKLTQITNETEFKRVCSKLNSIIEGVVNRE